VFDQLPQDDNKAGTYGLTEPKPFYIPQTNVQDLADGGVSVTVDLPVTGTGKLLSAEFRWIDEASKHGSLFTDKAQMFSFDRRRNVLFINSKNGSQEYLRIFVYDEDKTTPSEKEVQVLAARQGGDTKDDPANCIPAEVRSGVYEMRARSAENRFSCGSDYYHVFDRLIVQQKIRPQEPYFPILVTLRLEQTE
jgi:hypothetical protein